jgi:hypothetical protein
MPRPSAAISASGVGSEARFKPVIGLQSLAIPNIDNNLLGLNLAIAL